MVRDLMLLHPSHIPPMCTLIFATSGSKSAGRLAQATLSKPYILMCTQCKCKERKFAIDAEIIVHNRAAAKLPPLPADLIARLESCNIPMKGAPDVEVRAALYVVTWDFIPPFLILFFICDHCLGSERSTALIKC